MKQLTVFCSPVDEKSTVNREAPWEQIKLAYKRSRITPEAWASWRMTLL
jgi:hypothetical protein